MPSHANESPDDRAFVSFPMGQLAEQLAHFASRWPDARGDDEGRSFVGIGASSRLWLPYAAPRAQRAEPLAAYAGRWADVRETQFVLLLQAGAVALGAWADGELVAHKAIRKYVVRGHGHAQPTHAKTRGKSRYGSRLRLQNWKRLLVDTNERLHEWWSELGAPQRVFFSAPVRAWPELWQIDPSPPFVREDARLERVPIHVHRPDHEELLAVRRWLERGRLEVGA